MATTTGGTPYVASTDLVANYPTTSASLAARVDQVASGEIAYSATSQTITVAQILQGVTVVQDSASSTTVTLPTTSLVNGMQLKVVNINTGTVTISGGTIVGSTTISTQYQALTLVYRSTGTTWYSTAEGSSPGLSLVSPTSIANSGGSASASGGAITFTGVSSISLNSVFSSTFDNYQVVIEGLGSNTTTCYCRLRLSGTDVTGTDYQQQTLDLYSSTVSASRATGQTFFRFGAVQSTRTSGMNYTIYNPARALPTTTMGLAVCTGDTGGTIEAFNNYNVHGLSTAYDGLTLYPPVGTITGVIRVYGYKNS